MMAEDTVLFMFNGVGISDPYMDETGRFEVEPEEYYQMRYDNLSDKWIPTDPDLCRCHGYPEDECPYKSEH